MKDIRASAELGDPIAQYNLGFMYADGGGVAQDYVLAHMWFDLAATQANSEHAAENRDIVAKKMTAADVSKAQRMATEWLRAHSKAN